jgi:DNA polymerase-3 subunit delta
MLLNVILSWEVAVPVTVFAGEEDYLVARRVAEAKAKLLDPAWVSFNFTKLDQPDLRSVIDAAAMLPFGPGNKLVLIDRCDLFTKKRGKGSSDSEKLSEKTLKALLDDLDCALNTVAPNTHLVFSCPYNFDSTLRVSKVVEKHARLEHFPKERYFVGSHNPKLETWCSKEAHRWEATIADDAISYLLDSNAENNGVDLRQISSEIEKAAIYVLPGKHITLEIISQLSPHQSHVFSLLEHWAMGRRKEALDSLSELLSRQSGIPILAALQTTLGKWLHYKAACEQIIAGLPTGPGIKRRELPVKDLARKLAVQFGVKEYPVEMDLKRIAGFTTADLAARRVRLSQLEYMVKTGQISDQHALTLFIAS